MRDRDTSIGAGYSAFARTKWADVVRAGAGHREQLEEFARLYWRPVYKYVRIAWSKGNEDAKDLTQEFLAHALQPEFLAKADPARGSFRTYLLASLRNFLRDDSKRARAAKRGGDVVHVPIELDRADSDPPAPNADPVAAFERSWADELLADALAELEAHYEERDRAPVFHAFREYCLEGAASYGDVAERLGLTVAQVTNHIFRARRELRRLLGARVEGYVGSPDDVDRELKELFGS